MVTAETFIFFSIESTRYVSVRGATRAFDPGVCCRKVTVEDLERPGRG